MSPGDIYHKLILTYNLELAKLRKRGNLVALLRLLLFLLVILALVFLLNINLILASSLSAALFATLLYFVHLSTRISARITMLNELTRINEEEKKTLEWKYNFFHPGDQFIDPDHPNSADLDLFGHNSLFQFLNRTSLSSGSGTLAAWLQMPASAEEINSRQQAIAELSGRVHWRQDFLARGRISGESQKDREQILLWLEEKPFLSNKKFARPLLLLLPFLTILSIILAFGPIPYNIPIFLVLIQLGIVGLWLRQINHHHNQLSRKYKLLSNISGLIGLLENEEFESAYIKELKEQLSSSGIIAGHQLKILARLVIQFDRRLNMIMAGILNGILMWDLLCVYRLERWKLKNAGEVPRWLELLGKTEALNSLANFHFNTPGAVFPETVAEGIMLDAGSLGHPLIPSNESIRNDVVLERTGQFMLVTGSNMAGKSTFLRTIGVNLVLAGAGAPVIADKMSWQPLRVLSSMRVKDNLLSRESTFYAELKRLRMIIEVLSSGERVFVLLDEILKGTNSKDKHYGSEMFIRQLLRENCSGLIATHDLELSTLEEELPGKLLNYSFEVSIENEEFHFDYKLRKGVCRTLNATELMKKMGISIE